MVYNKTKAKANKVANIQEIRAKLCGSMGVGDTHLINEEDDDEDVEDQDVYMYPTNMHPDEWSAHRSAVCASKATEWERQQYENIVGSKHKTRKSSHPTCTPTMMRKSQMTNMVSLYEPLYMVLWLMDSEIVPIMMFMYKLMHVMKENLIRQGAEARDWIFKIIKDYWEKTPKHPLHAVAYLLNPRFQYRHGVGSDSKLLQAVHNVFAKLDPTIESLGQFGNEVDSTSACQSSRPSATSTSASDYDGSRGGIDDEGYNSLQVEGSQGATCPFVREQANCRRGEAFLLRGSRPAAEERVLLAASCMAEWRGCLFSKRSGVHHYSYFRPWEQRVTEDIYIQYIGVPAVLEGRSVVLGSHAGSGKTLAYMLPLVQLLRGDEALSGVLMKPRRPPDVVLCSTRKERILERKARSREKD
ncbi:DEAD-box ATP-dependent RNA helicase 39 [Vitis vinifera]|uniref:DEAD-box ATP-dependent RNA helicase 39 n=1 Tax=Vitis vinifera TaxID=29760 RepID=A0A438E174_VITVI|nr:DEAD-box ATP-dependent RNA helicase 39 [Vitis vinifera]